LGETVKFRKRVLLWWDKDRRLIHLPPEPRRYRRRWGWRLLALALAVALGALGAQHVYDHGVTGAIKSANAFIRSIGKPLDLCQEGYRTRCVVRN